MLQAQAFGACDARSAMVLAWAGWVVILLFVAVPCACAAARAAARAAACAAACACAAANACAAAYARTSAVAAVLMAFAAQADETAAVGVGAVSDFHMVTGAGVAVWPLGVIAAAAT